MAGCLCLHEARQVVRGNYHIKTSASSAMKSPTLSYTCLYTSRFYLTMPYDIDDDEYVANLLKEDAKKSKKKYDLVGIDAFNPKRCVQSLHGTTHCAGVRIHGTYFP